MRDERRNEVDGGHEGTYVESDMERRWSEGVTQKSNTRKINTLEE